MTQLAEIPTDKALTKTRKTPRPGMRTPDVELDRRVAQVAEVLARNPAITRIALQDLFIIGKPAKDGTVYGAWKDKRGNAVHWKTVDRITAKARALIKERAQRDRNDIIADIMAGYEKDLAHNDPKVRMEARRGVRALLGLDSPARMDVTTAGQPTFAGLMITVHKDDLPQAKD